MLCPKGTVFIQNCSTLVNMQCIGRLDFINLFNSASFIIPCNGLSVANLAQVKEPSHEMENGHFHLCNFMIDNNNISHNFTC